MSLSDLSLFNPRKFKITAIVFSAIVIVSLAPLRSLAQKNFLPPEIQDIEAGISSSQVNDMIKNSGEHSTSDLPSRLRNEKRMKLVWPLATNMYYKQVEFEFTEKDRLYLLRFVLHDEMRGSLTSLKKQFFEKYRISRDEPGRMRMKNNDVILYLPDQGKWSFMEMRDVTTGQKSFELFDRGVSWEDHQRQNTDDSNAKQAEQGNSAHSKEGASVPSENKSQEPQGR
jgi:hypothetical protein